MSTKLRPLTPTERNVLMEMSHGNVLHRCVHSRLASGVSYFLSARVETVRVTTVESLLRRGLIEDVEALEWRWRGSRYELTKLGRSEAAR